MTLASRDADEQIILAAVSARADLQPAGHMQRLEDFFARPAGRAAGQIAIVAAILAIWQFGSGRFLPHVWVSSPSAIFTKLVSWFVDGSIWIHLAATLSAASSGYIIGSLSGIASGLLLGLSPRLERILSPFVTALYSLPKVALAPFFVIFLGIGVEFQNCSCFDHSLFPAALQHARRSSRFGAQLVQRLPDYGRQTVRNYPTCIAAGHHAMDLFRAPYRGALFVYGCGSRRIDCGQ